MLALASAYHLPAFRTPERMFEYARSAHQRGIRAIIAGALRAVRYVWLGRTASPLLREPLSRVGRHDGRDV